MCASFLFHRLSSGYKLFPKSVCACAHVCLMCPHMLPAVFVNEKLNHGQA